ncbi:hypothetical protein, partial [Oscillatoria sp. FACHB-1407]|uniref:hypothetical protein n=1 Tax=Oscillatoria sp. FACHB-1407 TaxID=2692847 RepID=UPI001A7E3C62
CNQKVDVIVLVDFGWIHSLVLLQLPLFLNCVTPDGLLRNDFLDNPEAKSCGLSLGKLQPLERTEILGSRR